MLCWWQLCLHVGIPTQKTALPGSWPRTENSRKNAKLSVSAVWLIAAPADNTSANLYLWPQTERKDVFLMVKCLPTIVVLQARRMFSFEIAHHHFLRIQNTPCLWKHWQFCHYTVCCSLRNVKFLSDHWELITECLLVFTMVLFHAHTNQLDRVEAVNTRLCGILRF